MIPRRRFLRTAAITALAAATLAACTHSGPTKRTTTPTPTHAGAADSVSVLGLWSGPELDSFVTVEKAWEKGSGFAVDWQGSQDPARDLAARIGAGKPPDLAVLPNVAVLHQLARAGKLVPLDTVLDRSGFERDYPPAWRALGSDGGRPYGIFYKVSSKSTVWYDPKTFAAAGYRVPATWDAMTALADRIVADGRTPFSIVAAQGPAAGWALTDWVASIVLNRCGPAAYDKWVSGALAWTSGCIKAAFEQFLTLVRRKGYVHGGVDGIIGGTDSAGAYPMYTDPPGAYLYYLSSFAQAFIAQQYPTLRPGPDYDFFPFPAIDPRYRGSVMVGADIVVMTHDTPAARSLLRYLAGPAAQERWIHLGGFTSVSTRVPLTTYPDPVARQVAQQLTAARTVRFSAGDSLPADVQRAWWQAMLELVRDPAQLPNQLASLDAAARAAH